VRRESRAGGGDRLIRTAAGSGTFGGVAEGDRLAGRRRRRVEIGVVGDGGSPGLKRGEILLGFLFGLLGFYCFSVVGSPGRTGWFGHEVEQV